MSTKHVDVIERSVEQAHIWINGVAASGSLRDLPDRGLWVRLAEQPGREFVFGAVGRFWGDAV